MLRKELALWHAPLTDSRDGCVHKPQRVETGATESVTVFRHGKSVQWFHGAVPVTETRFSMRGAQDILIPHPYPPIVKAQLLGSAYHEPGKGEGNEG